MAGGWASSQVLGLSSQETRARVGQAFASGLGGGVGNALGGSLAEPSYGNWPDQAGAESARLVRQNGSLMDAQYVQQSDAILNRKAGDAWTTMRDHQGIEQSDAILRRKGFETLGGRNGLDLQSDGWVAANGPGMIGKSSMVEKQLMASQARARFNFSDGMDARDIRQAFAHQSRVSRGLSDRAMVNGGYSGNYAEARPTALSAREKATGWFSSVVGTSRAGNVLTGAFNAWLAAPEALPKLPDALGAIPSVVMRLASGAAASAGRLWDDPFGTTANTVAGGVDSLRTGFNRVVNGNGTAMGATLFAIGTAGVPLGRADGLSIPLGLSGRGEFLEFGNRLYTGLDDVGFKRAQAGFQGSSVTGRAFESPHAPFDVGRISDFDIALSSPELLVRAQSVGIGLRGAGTRTGPLMPEHLERLGLADLARQLSQQAGREVNFMIYRSIEDAASRSPTILVPRNPR